MKYKCSKSRQEIIVVIMKRFDEVNANLSNEMNDFNYGQYKAMIDLLSEIKIYESEE